MTASSPPVSDSAPQRGWNCGDPEQLSELVRTFQAAVYRYLRSLGCSPQLAEELAIETFAIAHDKRFAAISHAAMAAALRQAARLIWLERTRQQGRQRRQLLAAADALWDRTCARDAGNARLERLRSCLAELRGRAAVAVQLFYRDGLSRQAAAKRLQMLPDGFKTLLQRTRKLLRACIERRQGSGQ